MYRTPPPAVVVIATHGRSVPPTAASLLAGIDEGIYDGYLLWNQNRMARTRQRRRIVRDPLFGEDIAARSGVLRIVLETPASVPNICS